MLASYGGTSVRKFNFKRLALRIIAFQFEYLPSWNESDIFPKHLYKIIHFTFFPSLFRAIEAGQSVRSCSHPHFLANNYTRY
jgi:hypothetical protein